MADCVLLGEALDPQGWGEASGKGESEILQSRWVEMFHVLPGHARDDTRVVSTLAQNLKRTSPWPETHYEPTHSEHKITQRGGSSRGTGSAPCLQRAPAAGCLPGAQGSRKVLCVATGCAILASLLPVRLHILDTFLAARS